MEETMSTYDLDDVCSRLDDIKTEIKESRFTVWPYLVGFFLIPLLFDWAGAAWHSKMRYATQYSVPETSVTVADKPHDCAFLASPLGEKYCHHERVVTVGVVWHSRDTNSNRPIVSYDDGKTWAWTEPDYAGPFERHVDVYVGWNKVDD
jgi:hypothetical protein